MLLKLRILSIQTLLMLYIYPIQSTWTPQIQYINNDNRRINFELNDVHVRVKHSDDALPESKSIKLPGDIMVGGLFPMHEEPTIGERKRCGPINADKGIQRMEAMLYAIDEINKNTTLLPNITLGVHILDTCSNEAFALEQTLEFIKTAISQSDDGQAHKYECEDGSRPTRERDIPIAAVIGAAASKVSKMVASMLQLFKLPQISYSSTTHELSDRGRYQYFSRVVPPDKLQAKAIADVVLRLNWTYVQGINDDDSYGNGGMDKFKEFASHFGICMPQDIFKIKADWTIKDYMSMLQTMRTVNEGRSRGVVVFANEEHVNLVAHNDYKNHFSFVASDSWGAKDRPVRDYEEYARGAITIAPDQKPDEDFTAYFKLLNHGTAKNNVWFDEFWQYQQCNVTTDRNVDECLKRRGLVFKQVSLWVA